MELPLDLSVRKTSVDDVTSGDYTNISTSGDSPSPYMQGTGFIACNVSNPSVTRHDGEVSMSLLDAQIWEAFNHNGTEMIINKAGRRMFPHVAVSASGLSPSGLYNVWLEILPADGRRFKYVQKKWLPVSPADPCKALPPYLHLDSPNTGAFWMQKKISFARLKLTNNRDSVVGNVMLQSMHKYMVRILISETGKDCHINVTPPKTFTFPETTFIAVTAYQNSLITKLKIHNNPFAKAFRDKHIGRNCQKQTCGPARSFSAGHQDTSLSNRKRKFEPSKEDAAFKDRAGHTSGISALVQAMSRRDLVTPLGWDIMPSERGSRPMCDVGQHTGLSPLYGPFHHQTSSPADGFCHLPSLMYPTNYLLSTEVFLTQSSSYPLPHPANIGNTQSYTLRNLYKHLSKDGGIETVQSMNT
ncbi:T-box-containing protein TBX6L-like [Haliotis asinina]|uniref:T-box-containing protein TBX6L-like n=1 Tax=Haliotis asinina TaxID=109174 RepID=UPI0035320682